MYSTSNERYEIKPSRERTLTLPPRQDKSPKYAPSNPRWPVCFKSPCGDEIISGLKRRREEKVFFPSTREGKISFGCTDVSVLIFQTFALNAVF